MKNEERRAKKRKIQNKKAFRLRETPSCSVGEEGIKIPRFSPGFTANRIDS